MIFAISSAELTAILVVAFLIYVICCYPLARVAGQTTDHAADQWMAFVPIANLVLMCWIARVSCWSILILLLSFIPVLGILVSTGYNIFLWVKIGARFQRVGMAVIAGIIPVLGAWLFAFSVNREAYA